MSLSSGETESYHHGSLWGCEVLSPTPQAGLIQNSLAALRSIQALFAPLPHIAHLLSLSPPLPWGWHARAVSSPIIWDPGIACESNPSLLLHQHKVSSVTGR